MILDRYKNATEYWKYSYDSIKKQLRTQKHYECTMYMIP